MVTDVIGFWLYFQNNLATLAIEIT